MSMELPLQPIYRDERDVIRFQANAVVRHLLDCGGLDLNDLAAQDFPQADREQFYSLIGHSICGFHALSDVSNATALRASAQARATLDLTAEQYVGCRDHGCVIHYSGVPREHTL